MKTFFAAAILSTVLLGGSMLSTAYAAEVPCENTLKKLRAEEKTVTMTDDVKKQVTDLEAKGLERCKADDDKRANEFFNQALALLGK